MQKFAPIEQEQHIVVDQSNAIAGNSVVAGDQINSASEHISIDINTSKVEANIVTTNATTLIKAETALITFGQNENSKHLDRLINQLYDEAKKDHRTTEMLEGLMRFKTARVQDGIAGLEQKLKKANREDEYIMAIEKKEAFSKLLEAWSMFESAQHIFLYLLGRAKHEFEYIVLPQIDKLSRIEINDIVTQRIVTPTVNECSQGLLNVDHDAAMGIVYWLAEQCFVKWHK